MNAPSIDIKDIFEQSSSGLSLVFGTDLFIGDMPERPDNCVCIYDTGGFSPETRYTYRRPTIQVVARNNSYADGNTQIEEVFNLLHTLTDETVNSTRYVQILAQGDIIPVGIDDDKRRLFSANFAIHRTT